MGQSLSMFFVIDTISLFFLCVFLEFGSATSFIVLLVSNTGGMFPNNWSEGILPIFIKVKIFFMH